jgi:MFS transporter, putative metabolite:H+ symporter
MHPVIVAEKGAWREIFLNPLYRGRTIVVLICWLLGYAGLIYGSGAFAALYMVDHGATPHFVFLTFVVGGLVVFLGFQVNARISERVERRDVLCVMACLFAAAFVVVYLVPNLWIIATFFVVSRIGVGLWLFNLYNYTAVAYPTRIRAAAFAWTDGLGHLGAWGGVTLLGPLYTWGPNHLGWFLWVIIPGALLPAIVIRLFGIRQSGVVLEQVST